MGIVTATTAMKDLLVGTKILDTDGSYSDVFMFTHQDSSGKLFPFVQLTTEDGSALTASEGHFVNTAGGIASAGSLTIGSLLVKADGRLVTVTGKQIVHRLGLYNPQTLSGSLVVDGFAVSAYTQAVRPSLAHAVLSPFRLIYRILGRASAVHHCLGTGFANRASRLHAVLSREIYGTEIVAF
jgi:Hint module